MKQWLFSIGLVLLLTPFVQAQTTKNETDFIVKPYLQFATKNSIVVLWETKEKSTSKVEFGKAVLNSGEPVLNQNAIVDGSSTMHEVVLSDLETETNYFWRIVSKTSAGKEIVSDTYSFKTAVNDSTAFMFALIGDTQRNNSTPWAWKKIAQRMWEDRPSFAVLAGDIVDNGNNLDDWTDEFFPPGHVAMSRFPIYTVLGNHENDSDYYYQYMANPAPEYYYTFKYGNAQFFMIDSNRDISEGSEQYNWLEWELAKSDATWKIAVQHHPPFTSEENDSGDTFKEASTYGTHARYLVPLFEKYNLDFDLFGHVHMYERTWPIKDNLVNQEDGVVYINSGGAGGGLEDFAPTRTWFTAELQTGHHYCTFAIHDKTVIFKAIDHEGRTFDTFQLTKEKGVNNKASVLQPPSPKIKAEGRVFEKSTVIALEAAFEDNTIFYTTDGSEPNQSSKKYTKPFTINNTSEIKVIAYSKENRASRVNKVYIRKLVPMKAVKVSGAKSGLAYTYYEEDVIQLPDFSKLKAVSKGVAKSVTLEAVPHREDDIVILYEGFVEVKEDGRYKFNLASDDGSKLFLHNQIIIDNDGEHGMKKISGEVLLEKGKHPIRVEFFESGGGEGLILTYEGPGFEEKPIAPFLLSHK
tara:strand:+ start:14761 stop:16668 length:1908 start_codon:yes stop_codon:yes gene_type:complete